MSKLGEIETDEEDEMYFKTVVHVGTIITTHHYNNS